jgi:hypothetical protein
VSREYEKIRINKKNQWSHLLLCRYDLSWAGRRLDLCARLGDSLLKVKHYFHFSQEASGLEGSIKEHPKEVIHLCHCHYQPRLPRTQPEQGKMGFWDTDVDHYVKGHWLDQCLICGLVLHDAGMQPKALLMWDKVLPLSSISSPRPVFNFLRNCGSTWRSNGQWIWNQWGWGKSPALPHMYPMSHGLLLPLGSSVSLSLKVGLI